MLIGFWNTSSPPRPHTPSLSPVQVGHKLSRVLTARVAVDTRSEKAPLVQYR